MHNELVSIGPVTIYGYGMMIALGILVAYKMVLYRAATEQIEQSHISSLTFLSLLGGFAGAKLLYWITQINKIVNDPGIVLNVSEGFVIYGGIIGGILAGYAYCRKKKINFFQHLDLFIPSIALAQGFGRIGCLLAGCCYGEETQSWFGITFHHSEFAPNDVKLVPTQIMESLLNFSLFFALIYVAKKYRPHPGGIAGLYLVMYSLGRFGIEFFRGDLIRGQFGGLATSQWIAIGVVLVTSLAFLKNIRKKPAIFEL
ncbi:prolipoprotein diacylglyceryl transferase [Paenibacillus ginsengarvi]|uniref:Phosphatidylglycerol--prolipoprotein diacylglyceryl transferase n=1 Tax=Paenibacillus ginsengarvi TaxID=400777 RepID=A0A3B0AXC2_9BACL|nr:prolipoprotein diacylglyceryl transferase [Paenibacillus ginsengarvi]RKN64456.1 prolipoprotein diacylglyceryl transferase [Paenibacillus ginsengarvi]